MTQLTDLQVLMAARKLLMDPRRWTKGAFAKKGPDGGETCYCALGAIGAACGIQWRSVWSDCLTKTLGIGDENQWQRVGHILSSFVAADHPAMLSYYQETGEDQVYEDDGGFSAAVPAFNDWEDTTYEDVMELFSDAIQALVAEQEVATA